MRKESVTVQKCKKQMASLGFDSQLAYHRVPAANQHENKNQIDFRRNDL